MNSYSRTLFTFAVVIATAVAACAEFTVTVGAGLASLAIGTPRKSFVATNATKVSASFYRLGGEWRDVSRFGASLDFSDYQTARRNYATDYSHGIPLVVPSTQLDFSLQAARLGVFYDFAPSPHFSLRPTAGLVWSALDSSWSGQQEGTTASADRSFGYHAGLSTAVRWRERMTVRLSIESLWTGARVLHGDDPLSALQSALLFSYDF